MKEITASGIRWQQFDLKRRKLPKRLRMERRFLRSLLLPVGAVRLPVARVAVVHEAARVVAVPPWKLLPRGSKQGRNFLRRN
jgi:hypothetical protein